MTDATLVRDVGALHTSDAARARLKKRYAAEARFKAYGIGALSLAALFLALFLSTIVRDGFPAFFQNYALLEVELPKADFDPQGTNDPKVVGQADFDSVVRSAMQRQFPELTERVERRSLSNILSSGAPVLLRDDVLRNLNWVGTTQRYAIPFDDISDLYFKGQFGTLERIEARGEMGVSGTRGTVQLSSTSNNFEPIVAEKKRNLERLADQADRDVENRERNLQRLVSVLETRRGAGNAERIAQAEQEVTAARAELERLRADAASFRQRSQAAGQAQESDNRLPSYFVRMNGGMIKLTSVTNSTAQGTVMVPLKGDATARVGEWQLVRMQAGEADRRLGDREIAVLESMRDRGLVESRISREFFTSGASREAELAGVWSAIVGSLMTLGITLLISFPIGVAAALYLEEFAPKNRITEVIEVNINNLAAVPSIIYGLLGLAVFLNVFDMPRSAPVVGGLVLALMTLPIIIIASRAAIRSVPPSVKEAALGLGASHLQAVTHHVLPLAMPGILTGTILGMAHALGETAPLLMIGMVAFVVDVPKSPLDAATLLPVQIFMWADFPEVAFQQKTAAAIIVLLLFLICMNALAVVLRKRFERRW
jgi:phosphate transport system permease protein